MTAPGSPPSPAAAARRGPRGHAPGARPATADLAVLGGGQLGLLLARAGAGLGVRVHILDPDPRCPAAPWAARFIRADWDDAAAIALLAQGCDALTLEIEVPPPAALAALERAGVRVLPGSRTLARIQDKLRQRRALARAGLPQPRFAAALGPLARAVAAFGGPCVVKARRAGYDGKGVLLPQGPSDPRLAGFTAPCLLEARVDLALELAVVVVRGRDGAMVDYDPVELAMDPRLHLMESLAAPARIAPGLARRARALARAAAVALGAVGAVGVELFVDRRGRLSVNEVSPRVHNSGHHSLEACATSQFENHLRAVLGWPLGETRGLSPAATANLLGPAGLRGPYRVEGLEEALALPGLHVHLFGKADASPGRKLGHVTALALAVPEALRRVRRARRLIRFVEAS